MKSYSSRKETNTPLHVFGWAAPLRKKGVAVNATYAEVEVSRLSHFESISHHVLANWTYATYMEVGVKGKGEVVEFFLVPDRGLQREPMFCLSPIY